VIQLVPAPVESMAIESAAAKSPLTDPAPAESPPADPTPAESSAEPLYSAVGDALTETS
jgi:hypothetical protein